MKGQTTIDDRSAEAAKPLKGRLNIYTCDTCFGHIVTKDLHAGVTPFIVSCRATAGCNGSMKSSMYRVFDQTMRPDFVWRRPTTSEASELSVAEQAHVQKGGTLLFDPKIIPSDYAELLACGD